MSGPTYLPESAGSNDGNSNLLSAEQANVSGEGTSKNTLKTDFTALAGYLTAITGGPTNSPVTANGSNTFGKQYFYNTGSKCTIESSDNLNYCNPSAAVGDTAYEYIYVNTVSNGLMPGIIKDIGDMLEIPVKVIDVMKSKLESKCTCVPLNVKNGESTECVGAFINSNSLNDASITNNKCNNPVIDDVLPLASGFTTMTIYNIHKNIDRLFLFAIGILCIIVLFKLVNK
jgi:hypothetical protein